MINPKKPRYAGSIAIVGLVIAILSLMVLPLPSLLIDSLLALNMSMSVLLLMAAIYAPSASSLSAFPSLLLFTTLLRLSLNIAATKAILMRGDAGHIIESFGNLVVGGNVVIGMTVFAIIAAVQFIVIAKGTERASEVSARFALDGLPGQQMSIDADLRAGSITTEDARHKRAMLTMESQLHGSMDGAMKFVKGDAIAGLVITLINIVAGMAVGMSFHGMTMAEAARRYSVLSIGDAMVSQIPSLLISVAAGVLTTRVLDTRKSQRDSLGGEILQQLGSNAAALYMTSLLLLAFAAVPGFPYPLFLMASGGLAFAAWRLHRRQMAGADASDDEHGANRMPSLRGYGAKTAAPMITDTAPAFTSPLGLRVAADLALKISPAAMEAALAKARSTLSEEFGVPFPGMAIWSSDTLDGLTYEILVQDVPVANADLNAHLNANMNSGTGRSAEEELAQRVMAELRERAHLFVGIQETQWLFDKLTADYPGLIAEVQKILPLQRISDVLRRLLEEQIPIRNLRGILESLVYWGPKEKDLLVLTEYVRGDLGRLVAHRAAAGSKSVNALFLHVDLEQTVRQAIKPTPTGNYLALPPEQMEGIVQSIASLSGSGPRSDLIIVTAMDIRRYVRRMIQRQMPWLNVFSYQELGEHLQLISQGTVEPA